MTKSHLNKIKSVKMIDYWKYLPNPDHYFFQKNGVCPSRALKELSYIPEVQSAVLARESAVIGDAWEITGDNPEEVQFVKNNFEDIGINSLFREIFNAIWLGYTILQHPIKKINNRWQYDKINALPSEWFCFDKNLQLVPKDHPDVSPLNIRTGDLEKEVELVQYRSGFTNPYGESTLARVFWSATWIKGTIDMWISYIDRFGDDSIIGKVDLSSEDKKMAMLHAIKEFKSSGAIVIEGNDSIDILNANKIGSSQLFNDFYDLCSKQICKVILGHSSALDSTPGKLGNETSISIVRQDITQDDKSMIEEVINRLIKHLCMINNFSSSVKFSWQVEKEDEKIRIARDISLYNMGFEFSEEYIYRTYQLTSSDIVKRTVK